jgi:uncharacterized protein DUF892
VYRFNAEIAGTVGVDDTLPELSRARLLLGLERQTTKRSFRRHVHMAGIDSLDTLLEEELRDTYDAEKQLTKALPKLAKKATAEELKAASSSISVRPNSTSNGSSRSSSRSNCR